MTIVASKKKQDIKIVASKKAIELKQNLMRTPVQDFEPLTFGELKEGDSFICFPSPGDNDSHGGFKKMHYTFTKGELKTEKKGKNPKYSEKNPHGKATKNNTGDNHDFPHSMLVILIG